MEDYHRDPKESPREKYPLCYETTHAFVEIALDDEKRQTCSGWFSHVFWNERPCPEYVKEHFEIDNREVAEFFFFDAEPEIKLYLAMRWGL